GEPPALAALAPHDLALEGDGVVLPGPDRPVERAGHRDGAELLGRGHERLLGELGPAASAAATNRSKIPHSYIATSNADAVGGSTFLSTGWTRSRQRWSAGANAPPARYSGKRATLSAIVPSKLSG